MQCCHNERNGKFPKYDYLPEYKIQASNIKFRQVTIIIDNSFNVVKVINLFLKLDSFSKKICNY